MKSTGILLACIISIFFFIQCKQTKKNDVFPAIDFIKSQVADVDTSVYSIIKLVLKTDSTYDTTYIKRDDFKTLAKDFLETPDISKKFNGKYTEERMVNDDLGIVVFIASPSDKSLEVQRQEVRIVPNPPNDKVKSIYFEKFETEGNTSTIKRMTWYTDKKFQIVTITQPKDGEEKTTVMEVVWNDKDSQ